MVRVNFYEKYKEYSAQEIDTANEIREESKKCNKHLTTEFILRFNREWIKAVNKLKNNK